MAEKAVVQTSVQTIETSDLSDIFGPIGQNSAPGGNENEKPKPGLFTRDVPNDFSFLNKQEDVTGDGKEVISNETTDIKPKTAEELAAEGSTESIDDLLKMDNGEDAGTPEEKEAALAIATAKAGRPKTDKSGLVDFFKKEIEGGHMVTFDDYDETKQTLDEYLVSLNQKDLDELWTANKTHVQTNTRQKIGQEIFDSLPQELQYAYQYTVNGGTDIKGLLKALSQEQEVKVLNPEDPTHQELIARQFLTATQFGTEQEINEEIQTWSDLKVLDKKAKQFKPKLDKMQEQVVQAQLANQAKVKAQDEKAALAYAETAYTALATGDLDGLKLDKKTQGFLYNSLISAQYPSMSGKGTNLLNHLLEKYQFVEPNHALIAEALWLLSDPKTYRSQVSQLGANKEVINTVRVLKTEQGRKQTSSVELKDDTGATQKRTAIPRNTNIFARR